MKRRISLQVFLYFGIFIFISALVFTLGHIRLVDNSLQNEAITLLESDLKITADRIEETLNNLERDTIYLGKDLTYLYERPIYLIQDFLKGHNGVKGIYLYDEKQEEIGVFKEEDGYDTIVKNIISDQFFYTPIIWTEIDDGLYCISHKVTGQKPYYVAYVLNVTDYLEDFKNNKTIQATLFNPYGRVVLSTLNGRTEDLSTESYKDTLLNGHQDLRIEGDYFLAYRGIENDYVDFLLYIQEPNQVYRGTMRLYYIRVLSIILLLTTLGSLMAWKLVNKIYNMLVVDALSGDHHAYEFKRIKEELGRAIFWIDDVVMHYDELNELKEELVELNDRLPKEDDQHAKKRPSK